MSVFISHFLPRLRFTLLTATLLFVLSLNHQAVATYRVPVGKETRVGAGPKAALVKQKVLLEATAPLGLWLAPAADAWQPDFEPLVWPRLQQQAAILQPRPSAVPDLFRSRLLVAALSPHAP
ncbi:hypothetical protein [Hymenobacter cellulosilyticus]|uniref:Uncharacterized protein n=1 Tax=Hymenobacter cellulosilyticus TaxID=2932248 RepID=A0A8T9Q5H1_9BACT|nr:hypothetical protein [Hymenobacter cellulosilyticus]UOQ72345.1 hypothetical protein MUN79_28025 [Hymenobacter cellulosilyticus]